MNIETLWSRISTRIEMDGGVLHKSSLEEEVKAWVVLEKFGERQKAAAANDSLSAATSATGASKKGKA